MRRWTIPILALLVPVALVGGIWLGGHPSSLPGPVRDLLVDDQVATVSEALDRIDDDYYRRIPKDKLADAAVDGAVASLKDRFSAYFDPKEYDSYQDATNSQFSGVGLGVQGTKEGLRIARVYDKSPAKRAGLRKGDVIVAANGKTLKGKPEEAATALIKGPAGTEVTLTVSRGEKDFDKTMRRATISVPAVATRMRKTSDGKKVAQIGLASFSSGAHGEVYAAVRKAQKDGAKGIVFDLRGNPGGLVNEAQLIASAFLPDGPVVSMKGRNVPERKLDATGDPIAPKIPVAVLVDHGSASAAEIVAGALQDRKRAKLVGESTFGKGVFQQVTPLRNGGALDITVGQYFTPSGRNLGGQGVSRGKGLQPDIKVKDDVKTQRDEALDKAVDELRAELNS
ncbi:MAG: S41 family peptidase [Solirubrobacteraceae bacterium]|nr:S41 family peptidase [Solirubrobacteraceae bacterium]